MRRGNVDRVRSPQHEIDGQACRRLAEHGIHRNEAQGRRLEQIRDHAVS